MNCSFVQPHTSNEAKKVAPGQARPDKAVKQQPEPAPRSRSPQSTVTRRKLSSQLATDLSQPIALATEEKTVFELDPIMRSVPTTISKITATITAYSAMSWPSSDKSRTLNWRIGGCCLSFEDFSQFTALRNPASLQLELEKSYRIIQI